VQIVRLLVFNLLGLGHALFSAGARAEDLLQVYRAAVLNDAVYAAARAAFAGSREKLPQARAGLLPSVNASAITQWNEAEINFRAVNAETVNRQYNSNSFVVSLNQPLFRWQNWQKYKQAELVIVQAEAEYEQSMQQLIVRVVQAYFDVLAAEDNLTFLVAQKQALTEQLGMAKKSFTVGKANVTDLYDAQARYDVVASQELAARNGVEIRKRALRQITNSDPQRLTPLKASLKLNLPSPELMEDWVARAARDNPAVRAREAAVEVAARELAHQRAGHYPTLDLVANRGRAAAGSNTTTIVGSEVNSWAVGVQLVVPIFSGGFVHSKTREAIAAREQTLQEAEAARRAAVLSATQSFLEVTGGISQIDGLEAALKSNQVALDANRRGYSVGLRINNDVLAALQQLFSTQRDLSRARYDTILSSLRLKAAAGTLREADIEEINRVTLDHGQAGR
jgi:outer membrane protein